MGGRGTGSILLVVVVAAVIGVATLAAVGLLPGQATNVAVTRAGATATTFPFALGTGVPAPSIPPGARPGGAATPPTTTSAGEPSTVSTAPTTVPPDEVPSQATTTIAPVSESGGNGTTPTTAAASSSATTPTTEAQVSTPPANVDASDPTCSILQELMNEIDDADVRQAVRDEMRQSGCL